MSTKIYDAYEFMGKDTSFANVMKVLEKVKAETESNATDFCLRVVARKAQFYRDMWTYYGTKLFHSKSALVKKDQERIYKMFARKGADCQDTHLYSAILDEFVQTVKQEEFLGRDSKATVMLFPLGHRVLAMLFQDTHLVGDSFYKNFKDYHYQNQTDKPDDVTDAEWRKREKDWDRVLGTDYVPVRHGVTYELFNLDDHLFTFNVDRAFRAQKGSEKHKVFEKALKDAAANVSHRVKAIRKTLECPMIPSGSTYGAILSIMATDEYKKWAERKDKSIAKKLGVTLPKEGA